MRMQRIWTLTAIVILGSVHLPWATNAAQPVSLIPCTPAVALQSLQAIAQKCKAYGVAPVKATPEQVGLWDQEDAHPLYQLSNGHQRFTYDSCTGYTTFTRDDLLQELTEAEIKVKSRHWLDETKVKKLANHIKDALLPDAEIEQFILIDSFGHHGVMEHGVDVDKLGKGNVSLIFYAIRHANKGVLGNLRVEVDRSTGQLEGLGYVSAKCDLDDADVSKLLTIAKNSVAHPIVSPAMDKWGCCQPLLTTGSGDTAQFLDLTDLKLKPITEFYFASQSQRKPQGGCQIIHNGEQFRGEMFHPGNRLFYEPVVVNGAPLISSVYFPRFEISLATKQDAVDLTGLLPKTGKKAHLVIGSTQAIIDGRTVTLSNSPQFIEGCLHLPYELLNLCNRVLVRWDAKKNTLWIDTRYLRRG